MSAYQGGAEGHVHGGVYIAWEQRGGSSHLKKDIGKSGARAELRRARGIRTMGTFQAEG